MTDCFSQTLKQRCVCDPCSLLRVFQSFQTKDGETPTKLQDMTLNERRTLLKELNSCIGSGCMEATLKNAKKENELTTAERNMMKSNADFIRAMNDFRDEVNNSIVAEENFKAVASSASYIHKHPQLASYEEDYEEYEEVVSASPPPGRWNNKKAKKRVRAQALKMAAAGFDINILSAPNKKLTPYEMMEEKYKTEVLLSDWKIQLAKRQVEDRVRLEYKPKLEEARQKAKDANKTRTTAEMERKKATTERDQLKREMDQLQAQLTNLTTENNQLKKKNSKLTDEFKSVELEKRNLKELVFDLKNELATWANGMEDQQTTIDKRNTELEESKDTLSSMNRQFTAQEGYFTERVAEIRLRYEQKIDKAEQEGYQKGLRFGRAEMDIQRDEINKMNSELLFLSDQCDVKTREIVRLSNLLDVYKKNSNYGLLNSMFDDML